MSELRVNAVTDETGGNTATINGMTPTADSLQGFRNRLINSDMRIDQRNAGASVTATNAAGMVFPVDRWGVRSVTSTSGAFTAQQSSVAPTGFNNSLLATVSVAATPASTDQFFIQQRIEGFNIADLGLGTAAPSTFTLSFWVRSSVTGSFGGNAGNNVDLAYPFSFTINSANTWEQKTVTIVGPTTGTWNTTNGQGLVVHFSLGAGASRLGTANTWANYPVAPTGSVNWIANSGATFYITGVQLEAGSVATPFERRPYGQELSLCQRYYEQTAALSGFSNSIVGIAGNITFVQGTKFVVPKRTSPTVVLYSRNGTVNKLSNINTGADAGTTVTPNATSPYSFHMAQDSGSGLSAGSGYEYCYSASAEL